MIRIEVRVSMQYSGRSGRSWVGKHHYTDASGQRTTTRWAKLIIAKFFPEFVIAGGLILIHRTKVGYSASRCCTVEEQDRGFAWKYLDMIVTEVKEEAAAAVVAAG